MVVVASRNIYMVIYRSPIQSGRRPISKSTYAMANFSFFLLFISMFCNVCFLHQNAFAWNSVLHFFLHVFFLLFSQRNFHYPITVSVSQLHVGCVAVCCVAISKIKFMLKKYPSVFMHVNVQKRARRTKKKKNKMEQKKKRAGNGLSLAFCNWNIIKNMSKYRLWLAFECIKELLLCSGALVEWAKIKMQIGFQREMKWGTNVCVRRSLTFHRRSQFRSFYITNFTKH